MRILKNNGVQGQFDIIDHDIFFLGITFLGLIESIPSWYKSYLTNRTFLVNVENGYSGPGDLTLYINLFLDHLFT